MSRKRIDAIRDFLEGNLEYADLRYPERDYLEQLQLIEGLWCEGKTDTYVRISLLEKYQISENTARSLLKDCMVVFGDLKEINRKMMRYRASQMAVKAYEMAEIAGDYKAMIAATKAFSEANGINNEDPDLPPLENLEPSVNVLVIPESMEQLMLKQLESGNLNQLVLPDLKPEPITLDIEYDEPESGD